MTFSGDQLDFPGDPSSPATSMLTTKIHLNSTILDAKKGARNLNLDIKNFFLGSRMDYYQYARVHASLIPKEISLEYPDLVVEANGFVYFEARKGIHGLKEASLLAFKQLVTNLKPFGYEPCPFTPGLWHHTSRRTALASNISTKLTPITSFELSNLTTKSQSIGQDRYTMVLI